MKMRDGCQKEFVGTSKTALRQLQLPQWLPQQPHLPVVGGDDAQALLEWYIKLFLAVHFAANWVSVH